MSVELDAAQRTVLALEDGASAVVVGAPGSGKTETLIALARDRVERGALAPEEILAIAGSRRTASVLRDRLAQEFRAVTPGPLAVSAPALAFEAVRAKAASEGHSAPRLLTGAEQDAILRALLDGHIEDGRGPQWPDRLGPAVRQTSSFRTELRDLLTRVAEHGVGWEELARLGRDRNRPEWVAAAQLAPEYEAVVASIHGAALDAAELGDEAVIAIQHGRHGDRLARVRLLLVDELQDATVTTLRMLRAFASRGVAVIGFGDPDIAVNSFRGGAPDAVGTLRQWIGRPDAPQIVLDAVHRHGPSIRTVVSAVASRIGTAGEGRQRAAVATREDARDPVVAVVASGHTELIAGIARELRDRHLRDGVPWSELLVVTRRAGDVPELARALAHARVPTRTLGGGRALNQERAANELLRMVDYAVRPEKLDGTAARELLTGPYAEFDAVSLRRLRAMLRREELAGGGTRYGDELLAEALSATGRLATAQHPLARDYRLARRAAEFAERLAKIRALYENGATAEELLWEAWSGSGVAEAWRERALGTGVIAEETGRALDAVVALFATARRFAEREPDRSVVDFLDDLLSADIPEDSLAPRPATDAVLVATPAGAAGVEADTVVVAGLQESSWPDLRLRGSLLGAPQFAAALAGTDGALPDGTLPDSATDERRAVLSDELRMFALAASRARSRVVLAALDTEDANVSPLIGVIGAALAQADLVPDQDDPLEIVPRRPPAQAPLDLRGFVGHLRRELTTRAARPEDAARALAVLAQAGVAGADPDEWRGLAPVSTDAPVWNLNDPATIVPVSPSSLEKLERSSLEWFVDWAAATPSGVAAGLGTIIHAAMEALAGDRAPRADDLWALVEPRLTELEIDPGWELEAYRRTARRHVDALADYLARMSAQGAHHAASEMKVQHDYPVEQATARLSGKVDRVEAHADGIVIVDLKTGSSVTSVKDVANHPQLAAYQLAFADGEFASVLDALAERIGESATPRHLHAARLLFTAKETATTRFTIREQERMSDEALAAFRQRIIDAARAMARGVYRAVDLPLGGSPDVRRVQLPGDVTSDV